MKKLSKALLLITLLACTLTPAWGQSSTEGKEFWVALMMANSPDGFSAKTFNPFIAISAKKQCKVTISNPALGWSQPTRTVQADSWLVIDDIPNDKWYNESWSANNASEVVSKLGIKVEATEEVSVYAAIRMEYSYDATNVLPITALQSEYIIQDYKPYNSGKAHAIFTILAAEDNTTVAITPSTKTVKGKEAGTRFTITLNKGETYQVISASEETFSGTRVEAYATNDHSAPKPIAVFSGADFTQVPGGKSARDCLYEQAMPTDYWGTEFVVTRSAEKDANRIRITAGENAAEVYLDGSQVPVVTLKPLETWEFELSDGVATQLASAITGAGREVPDVILSGDAHYIRTSCPVAVYSYDVSSDYRFSETTKIGDPSMVWISPLQQRISKITFGACGTEGSTGHTNKHYVNIVCPTTDTASVTLSSEARKKIPTPFTVVPGNTNYSYARVFLVDTDKKDADKVYTLNSKGVVAHVYGSGYNESYAYSVGSATVKQGILVEDIQFQDGTRSDDKFCMGNTGTIDLTFDATTGIDEVTRVDWNFGDGITQNNGPAKTNHVYTAPGWYDVEAKLYGHQVCSTEDELHLATVRFTFRIIRPVYKFELEKVCQDPDSPAKDNDTIWPENLNDICEDTIRIPIHYYRNNTTSEYSATYADSAFIAGHWWKKSGDVPDTMVNADGCDSIRICHLTIITSLKFQVDATSGAACFGEEVELPFTYTQGDIGRAWFINTANNKRTDVPRENLPPTVPDIQKGTFTLPTTAFGPGIHNLVFHITDKWAESGDIIGAQVEYTFPIELTVYYPKDIFTYQFNNVLAVWKKGYGGNVNPGWEFVAYQWYRNDTIIEGATESVYHSTEPFSVGDSYYVVLTRRDGFVLRSCDQVIDHVDDYNPIEPDPEEEDPPLPDPEPDNAPAARPSKIVRNQQMLILHDGVEFNMFGQRVK